MPLRRTPQLHPKPATTATSRRAFLLHGFPAVVRWIGALQFFAE
jgi:hypothetical protein